MTVNEKIIQALTPFNTPIRSDFFSGDDEEYFTFNYADRRAAKHGDNRALYVVAYMQIHWFLPRVKDYLADRERICRALEDAGFTYPDVTEMIEKSEKKSDKDIRHVVFECEIEDEETAPED